MSRRAWLYGLGIAALLWAVVVLAIIFWNYIMVGVVCLVAWRILRRQAGGRRRRSTFARNVTAVSAAFAAWQSRWINPAKRIRARVPASAAPKPVLFDQEWDEIPF